jgi:hypothetical protein
VWKPAELERALLPTLEKLAALDEAQPFLVPVDPVALFIPVCVCHFYCVYSAGDSYLSFMG